MVCFERTCNHRSEWFRRYRAEHMFVTASDGAVAGDTGAEPAEQTDPAASHDARAAALG